MKGEAMAAGAQRASRRVLLGGWERTDWRQVSRSVLVHVKRDRISVAAGAFAFRWFLSLFPVVIALLGTASLLHIPHHVVNGLVKGVGTALPSGAAAVLQRAITHAETSPATLSATIAAGAVGLWAGLSGMVMVEETLNMAYELPQNRTFLRKRLLALPLLAAVVVLGGSASALVVFGPQLGRLIEHHAPALGPEVRVAWTALRWVVALLLMALLLSIIYHVAPNRRQPRWYLGSAGSLVATAMWAAISLGFSYYTTSFGSYTKTYGAFAGVAILIFWLFLTGVAIFVGAEIDAAVDRQRAARRAQREGAAVEAGVPGPPLPPPEPGTTPPP